MKPTASITRTPDMSARAARWTPAFRVEGHSMEPTLRSGDIALTRPRFRDVRRGQVVLVNRPGGPRLVKRVAGVAGDLLEMEAGRVRVNGAAVDGRPPVPGASVVSWRVPPGHLFLVGDNAAVSDDSRVWADPFVPHQAIAGVVLTRRPRPS